MKPPFPSIIDATMLSAFRECPQKFLMAYMQHWKPKGESVHLHAGGAFARGLEVARRGYFEENMPGELAVARGANALMEAYGDFEAPEFGSGSVKTIERMVGALEFYFAEWPLDNGIEPIVMPSGRRAIEFSFAEPLPFNNPETGEPVIYCGRTDMICRFAEGTYLEDDKTSTSLGEAWAKKWELRSQFTGYAWAAARASIPVNGVLVRGVSILKTKYGRAEAVTNRSQWEIDRWLEQVIRDLRRIEACWQEGYWDYNLADACDSYGGCQFVPICKSPTPNDWLPMNFERRQWDPLERTEHLLDSPVTGGASGLDESEPLYLQQLRASVRA